MLSVVRNPSGKRYAHVVVAVLTAAVCVLADAAIPGGAPRITVQDPTRDYELRAVAVSPSGDATHLLSVVYPKGTRSDSPSLVWTIIDASGEVLSQRDPLALLPPADAASLATSGADVGSALAITADGVAFLVLQTSSGSVRLVRLPRAAEGGVVRAVDLGGSAPVIRRVLGSAEHLLLLGSLGTQPLVVTLDTNGRVMTRYRLPEDAMTIVGAAVDADGSAVVCGERGAFPNETTWVGRLSAAGDVLKGAEFPGRPTDLAGGADGAYVVLLEKSGAAGSEVTAKGLDRELAERWTRSLVTGVRGATSFRASAVGRGFIVAGIKNRGLWLSRLESDGKVSWADASDPTSSPELEMTSRVELMSANDISVVAFSAFVVVGREQRRVVRAIRFRAN